MAFPDPLPKHAPPASGEAPIPQRKSRSAWSRLDERERSDPLSIGGSQEDVNGAYAAFELMSIQVREGHVEAVANCIADARRNENRACRTVLTV